MSNFKRLISEYALYLYTCSRHQGQKVLSELGEQQHACIFLEIDVTLKK